MKQRQKDVYLILIAVAIVALLVGITCAVLLCSSSVAKAEVSSIANNVNYEMSYVYMGYNSNSQYSNFTSSSSHTFTIYNGNTVVGTFHPVRMTWGYSSKTQIFINDDTSDITKRIVLDQYDTHELIYQVRPSGTGEFTTVAHTRIMFTTTNASVINTANSWVKTVLYQTLSVYNPTPSVVLTQQLYTYSYSIDLQDNAVITTVCDNLCTFALLSIGNYDWIINTSYSSDGITYDSYGTGIDNVHHTLPSYIVFPLSGYWRMTLLYGSRNDPSSWLYVYSNAVQVSTDIADSRGTFAEGYVVGYGDGETAGYQAGANFAEHNNLISLVWATFKMPFELLFGTYNAQDSRWENGLFTTTFLGVDLRAFVLGILSLSLIIRILRVVLGGSGGSSGE